MPPEIYSYHFFTKYLERLASLDIVSTIQFASISFMSFWPNVKLFASARR